MSKSSPSRQSVMNEKEKSWSSCTPWMTKKSNKPWSASDRRDCPTFSSCAAINSSGLTSYRCSAPASST